MVTAARPIAGYTLHAETISCILAIAPVAWSIATATFYLSGFSIAIALVLPVAVIFGEVPGVRVSLLGYVTHHEPCLALFESISDRCIHLASIIQYIAINGLCNEYIAMHTSFCREFDEVVRYTSL